jgi:uncharacterized protein YecT (DUF1311 family)
MRAIDMLPICLLFASTAGAGTTYSGEFDYKKVKSYKTYFKNKSDVEIEHFCTDDSIGSEDRWQCSHFSFERINGKLNERISLISADLHRNDADLKSGGEPTALPYFKRAQQYWTAFRDNECYSDTYSLGQASMRYMVFWDCMTRLTKARLEELNAPTN